MKDRVTAPRLSQSQHSTPIDNPAIDYAISMEHFRRPILSNFQRKVSQPGSREHEGRLFVETLLIIDLVGPN
jgi:hypothetical protein